MTRLFDEHLVRKCISLDGTWQFLADPENKGEAEQWFCGLPQGQNVIVPSVWNTQMGYLSYEGAAWYEKKFYTAGGTLRFVFEAVMTQADIWLDGIKLGSHYGGFCQFALLATEVAAGMHTLTVRADNSFDDQSVPMTHVDWWHYGGIPRSVSVEELDGICALSNLFDYTLAPDLKTAAGHFTATLYNACPETVTMPVSFVFDGETVFVDEVTLAPYETYQCVTPEFAIEKVRLWSVEDPQLYDMAVLTDTDDLFDRTGLRVIAVQGTQIFLNHKPLEIRGVNRHEENTDFGFAFPPALMQRDIDIIKGMYANSIRGAHYPNSRIFVDMLDEQGLTFWSEIPVWGGGFTPESCADPVVVGRIKQMHEEMVHYYYNHPCIIIWGMHNELPTGSREVRALTEALYPYLKEKGGNRLVTFASDKIAQDICFDLCDIACINRYDGWYYGSRDSWQEKSLATAKNRMQELGVPPKPIVVSEFGAAAIYGHHTFDDLKWTEEYQAELLKEALLTFHRDPQVVGWYIWQFCDIRTSPPNGLNRARHYNNKGILNEYRRPKQAYFAVKETHKAFAEESLPV